MACIRSRGRSCGRRRQLAASESGTGRQRAFVLERGSADRRYAVARPHGRPQPQRSDARARRVPSPSRKRSCARHVRRPLQTGRRRGAPGVGARQSMGCAHRRGRRASARVQHRCHDRRRHRAAGCFRAGSHNRAARGQRRDGARRIACASHRDGPGAGIGTRFAGCRNVSPVEIHAASAAAHARAGESCRQATGVRRRPLETIERELRRREHGGQLPPSRPSRRSQADRTPPSHARLK